MAKEVQVVAWCDVCATEDRRTEATVTDKPSPLVGDERLLDLCDPHDEQAEEVVLMVYTLWGMGTGKPPRRKPKAKPVSTEPERLPCPLCPDWKGSISVGALIQHGRQKHGLGINEMREHGYAV